MTDSPILITGAAGFIGFSLAQACAQDESLQSPVVCLDNINDYYATSLKYDRLAELGFDREAIVPGKLVQSNRYPQLSFIQAGLEEAETLNTLFADHRFGTVVNLAAQAGVRYSLENPAAYIKSNIEGFLNILECCRHYATGHLVYASSSSVYGNSHEVPFREDQDTNEPVSLYAATKRSNELMAHTYHHLYQIPVTGLRFFTVYGPWGRPDMSPMLFANAITQGRPIKVYNYGDMRRDFTFIDDIVDGILRVMRQGGTGIRLYNIGNSAPVELNRFIGVMEAAIGQPAQKELLPMQPGDVYETYADVSALANDTGYAPTTDIETGIARFAQWYRAYYGLN